MLNSLRFLREMVLHPGQTGAVAPSGRRLARAMIDALGPVAPGALIVELGPGTGSFTRVIRERRPHNPLLAIERNPRFVGQLRRRFPDAHIVEGCASQIRTAIDRAGLDGTPVAGVISGLPLLSLPKPLVGKVFASLADVLPEGTSFVNFTYSKRGFHRRLDTPLFAVADSRHVLCNFPPATVMTLRPAAEPQVAA